MAIVMDLSPGRHRQRERRPRKRIKAYRSPCRSSMMLTTWRRMPNQMTCHAPEAYSTIPTVLTTVLPIRICSSLDPFLTEREGRAATIISMKKTMPLVMLVIIEPCPVARLEMGDIPFIPRGVEYQYWTQGSYAKVLYVSSGTEGMDTRLLAGGRDWGFPTFPMN